jgi:hypothetical protein
MLISVLSGLIIAASTYYFGKNYSVKEVLAGYLATNIVFIPIVILKWYHFRNEKLNGISSS